MMGLFRRRGKVNWADPNCPRCHGSGTWWSGSGNMETCNCVFRNQQTTVADQLQRQQDERLEALRYDREAQRRAGVDDETLAAHKQDLQNIAAAVHSPPLNPPTPEQIARWDEADKKRPQKTVTREEFEERLRKQREAWDKRGY